MIREFALNFYDEIRVQVRIRTSRLINPLLYRNLYPLFKERIEKSRQKDSFDLIIQIGFPLEKSIVKKLSKNGCYVEKDYCRMYHQKKTIKSEVEIFGAETSTILVNIKVNLWGRILFPLDLLNALIHFVAFQKGMCLIHAGSICKGGNGMLLFGAEDCGKTFLVIHALRRDYDLIDDDFTFVHGKMIYNYSPFLVLKFYHRNIFPFLTWKDKIRLFAKEALSLLTYRYINLLTRVHTDKFFKEQRKEKVELVKICYLRKGDLIKFREIEEKKKLVRSIVLEAELCYPFLVRLSRAYSCVSPNSIVAMHWVRLEEKLWQYIEDVPCKEIQTPPFLTKAEIERIFEVIEHGG